MDWGTELWDQFENVDKHLGHGIDFGEKYSKFVKERCSIEQEYASKLRKLVKYYIPRKRDEDRSMFSLQKAFQSQISELNDIAGQHELVAEEMMLKISKVASNFSNELKSEKKKLYQDGRHLQVILDQQERSMEQTKKKFEKEWKDCERAQQYHEKLDSDSNATKADVEKAKHIWHSKKDIVESCKTDYGASLQQFNTEQNQHYTTALPKVFEKFKEMDQKRILTLKDLMVEYAKIDLKVKPIIEKCLDGMVVAANAIDPNLDCNLVVEKMKSGFQPPGDKEFEDFSQPHQHRPHVEDGVAEGSPRNSANIARQQNRKSGLSWLFGAKKVTESPDYSHLPPEQRKKKLQKAIDELTKELSKEDDGRKAIKKMQDVYLTNPALGDAGSLDAQLKLSNAKIDKLQHDLEQHEAWYADASGGAHASPVRSSVKPSQPVKTQPLSTPEQQSAREPLQRDQSFNDDFEDEPLDAIGTCTTLYDFEANSEGALSMKVGNKLDVIELDNGDGWTHVAQNGDAGYVPTSYIELNLYS